MSRTLLSSGSPDADLVPVPVGHGGEQRVVEDVALLEEDLALVVDEPALDLLAGQHLARSGERRVLDDLDLVVLVLEELGLVGDSICLARSSFSTPLRLEHLGADDGAGDARGNAERAVAHVARLLAEDGPEELLLGADSWVSPLGVIFPTRTSPGFTSAPMRMMPDSSRSLRASSPTFGMSRVISSLPELGVPGDALELLDVDRGEDVVLQQALGEEDRVLEVVALPRHEGDDHVRAQRQLTGLGGRPVGDDVALPAPGRPSSRWASGSGRCSGCERWYLSRL